MPFDAMTLASSWWENVSKMTGTRSGNFKQRRTLSNDGWDTGYSLFIPRHGVGGLGVDGNFRFPGGCGGGLLPSSGGGSPGLFGHKMDVIGDNAHAALRFPFFFPLSLGQGPSNIIPAA